MATFTTILKKKMELATFRRSHDENRSLAYLGVTITVERKNRELYQDDVAALAGVTQQMVSLIESGRNVETSTLLKVCLALKISHIPIYE